MAIRAARRDVILRHATFRARFAKRRRYVAYSIAAEYAILPYIIEEASFVAKQYSSPPAMQIDPNKHYDAVFHTQRGDFTVELFAKQAPDHRQ